MVKKRGRGFERTGDALNSRHIIYTGNDSLEATEDRMSKIKNLDQ